MAEIPPERLNIFARHSQTGIEFHLELHLTRNPETGAVPLSVLTKTIEWLAENGYERSAQRGKPTGPKQEDAPKGPACAECGGDTVLRRGVSEKTGKPYSGYFCEDRDNCGHVQWITQRKPKTKAE